MPNKDPFAFDFINSMRQLDVRKPKDMYAAMDNMKFAMAHVFDRLAAIEDQLVEENDELESLREAAIALAEHVVAGRVAEALELAQVVLSWYEDEKEPAADADNSEEETNATRTAEETVDSGAENTSESHDLG